MGQIKRNNPGNIRKGTVTYVGELPSTDAFKYFRKREYGYRAMFMILYTYQKRYGINTLREVFKKYAPDSDGNNSLAYAEYVAKMSDLTIDGKIDTLDGNMMRKIVTAMCRMENGCDANSDEVDTGWYLFRDSVNG